MRPYSYSRWGTYKGCPRKFKLAYRDRIARPPPGGAAERGLRVHASIEDFLNGESSFLDEAVDKKQYLPYFSDLKDRGAIPEAKFSFNDQWDPCGWEDEECYFRGLWDIHLAEDDQLNVWELKTGKQYDDHVFQRDLYGPAALLQYPQYETVTVTNVYLDQGFNTGGIYEKKNIVEYLDTWDKRIQRIESDELFIPAPSYACRWCPYSRHNGSTHCEF